MWDLNVKSTFFLIKECKEMLLKSVELSTTEKPNAANILVVSSVTGTNPNYTLGVYAATKAALDNLIKSLAQELMDEGIRVNGISPGLIKTEFSGALWKNGAPPEKSMGQAEHIASVVACICSKQDGAFMNGETYLVHGGFAKM